MYFIPLNNFLPTPHFASPLPLSRGIGGGSLCFSAGVYGPLWSSKSNAGHMERVLMSFDNIAEISYRF